MLNKIVLNGNITVEIGVNILKKIESLIQVTRNLKLQTTFVIENNKVDSGFVSIFKRKCGGKIILISCAFKDSTYFLGAKEISVFNSENKRINAEDKDSMDMLFNTIYYLMDEFKNDFKSNTLIYIESLGKESVFSTFLGKIETLYEFNCEQDQEDIMNTILKIKDWF